LGEAQPSYVSEAKSLFTDPEHFGAANRAGALGRRLSVLHGNALGILDLSLGSALNTISLHRSPPFLDYER
jgi:hypothetical protein